MVVIPSQPGEESAERDKASAARTLFHELVELPAAQRDERLAVIAAREPALAQRVAELLTADAAAPQDFADAAAAPTALLQVLEDLVGSDGLAAGERVGPYRLLALLGRGGMGEVWRAERADGQFERQVALKLVASELGSREIVERFLRERQILAGLEHPGIARLLDGGVAADGRPYFALELVEGESITSFARTGALDLDERVELVVAAAEAVAAAHARLVVHRDLKPSNILVTADGRVKLLDFGIAKLVAPGDGDPELTRTVALRMTPAYAAPEQVRGEPATTATDVYGLGAVLYELLTGRPAFERRASSAAELIERVRHETLVRPSRAVAEDLGGRRLARRLAGDLDTIVAKALHPDPGRRYASADAFAEDLRRYLARQPVLARPDSLRYRLGKLVRRNRVASAAATFGLLAILGGLALALWQASVARASARRATNEAAHARRVQELLIELFQGADPARTLGSTLTARQVLDEGVRRLPSELAADPRTGAAMSEVFARTYRSLGMLSEAQRYAHQAVLLRRRLDGPDSLAVAEAQLTAAEVAVERGDVAGSRRTLVGLLPRLDR